MRRRSQVSHELCRTLIPYLKVKADSVYNPQRGFAISVGIYRIGHALIDALIVQQLFEVLIDAFFFDANDFCSSRRHSFRAFRYFSQHHNRFTQRRSFFLNAAGISDDDISLLQKIDQIQIVDGRDEMDFGWFPRIAWAGFWTLGFK